MFEIQYAQGGSLFNNLRGNANFKALRAEWRQRLAEEGLLLLPAEVIALDEYEYAPFNIDPG